MSQSYPTSKYAGLPQGDWSLRFCAMAKDAPIFGYTIRVDGKTPPIASAGVSAPDHVLMPDPAFRITTGFTEAEVVACATLMSDAPALLAQRDELITALRTARTYVQNELDQIDDDDAEVIAGTAADLALIDAALAKAGAA